MSTGPDLVVALADGRTFTRKPPAPIQPEPESWETWARFLAQRLEALLAAVEAAPSESVSGIAWRYAVRDTARDALIGWAQWTETPPAFRWTDQC